MKPCLLGLSGLALTQQERQSLQQIQPAGYILFARNIDSPPQIAKLIEALRSLHDRQPLILIDQEGGRVQRLGPPHWRALPDAAALGLRYAADKEHGKACIQAWAQEVAKQFADTGANCCAAPVLDLAHPGAHAVIGDRAYSDDPDTITAIGGMVVEYLTKHGIVPVIKHLPGHGRALTDSHTTPGYISASLAELGQSDLKPFTALRHAPAAMTAHLIYAALDSNLPFTQSPAAIDWLRHELGFGGLLISDCIHMQALCGSIKTRIAASLSAGIDLVIDSHSRPAEWLDNYQNQHISPQASTRLEQALSITANRPPAYRPELAGLLDSFSANTATDPTNPLPG